MVISVYSEYIPFGFVCLFVSNKRLNGWTDKVDIQKFRIRKNILKQNLDAGLETT